MAEERFLGRWSRRKLELPETGTASEPVTEPEPEDTRSDEEILADLDLPHPDDLRPGDDIRRFMDKAVPDRLRRLALRQLWRSNPVLANVDGLVEYGEDYTDAATIVENMQTLYQVGKGMWRDLEETVAEVADENVAGSQPCDEPSPQNPEPTVAVAEPDETMPTAEDETAEIRPTRRRMAFSYTNES